MKIEKHQSHLRLTAVDGLRTDFAINGMVHGDIKIKPIDAVLT